MNLSLISWLVNLQFLQAIVDETGKKLDGRIQSANWSLKLMTINERCIPFDCRHEKQSPNWRSGCLYRCGVELVAKSVYSYCVVSLPKSMFIIDSKFRIYYTAVQFVYIFGQMARRTFLCPHTQCKWEYCFRIFDSILILVVNYYRPIVSGSYHWLCQPAFIIQYVFWEGEKHLCRPLSTLLRISTLKFEPDNDLKYYDYYCMLYIINACKVKTLFHSFFGAHIYADKNTEPMRTKQDGMK